MFSEAWQVGQELTPEQVEQLFADSEAVEVLSVTTHPTPGGHFDGPHEGNQLLLVNNRWLVSSIPDPDNDDTLAHFYLGSDHSHGELLDLAVDFLVSNDHEVAAAVGFYFNEEKISVWQDEFAKAIDQLYWFRCELEANDFNEQLKQRMHSESEIFNRVAALLSDPQNPEFSDLKHKILNDWSFEHVYRTHKYSD